MSMEQEEIREAFRHGYTKLQPPETIKTTLFASILADGQGDTRRSGRKASIRPVWITLGAAVLCLALIVGTVAVSPAVQAAMRKIPFFGLIIASLGDLGEKNAAGHAQPLEFTAEDKGVRITIREVLYDGTRITIGYETNLSLSDFQDQIMLHEILIDGQEDMLGLISNAAEMNKTEDGTRNTMTLFPSTEFPDQFELDYHISKIGQIEGSWAFKIPVSLTTTDVRIFEPNVEQQFDDLWFTVKKIMFAPTATRLDIEIRQPREYVPRFVSLDFDVYDDQGTQLFRVGYTGAAKEEISGWRGTYEPMNRVPAFITIKPRYDIQGVTDQMGSMKIPLTP